MQIKYLIIINKAANGGETKRIWPKIKATLDHRHVNYTATVSKYHRNALLITEEYIKQAHDNDILLVIGGDGTLNEVVNESEKVVHAHPKLPTLPIAYLPTGKRNNFARIHHISTNWRKALNRIINNGLASHNVKIGYFNETIKNQRMYFLNSVGIGLDADLLNILHHSKINWRVLRYFIAIFYLLYNLQSFTMELYRPHDTKTYQKVFLANVALTPNLKGPNFKLTIIERHNLLIMFYIFFKLLFKRPLKFKSVHCIKTNHLHLGIPTLEYGHADGEDLGDRFYDSYYHVTKYPFI